MTSFVWDAEVVEHLLFLVRTQSTAIGLLYSIQVFPSRIKDGELEMDISRQKSEALKNIQPRPKNEIFLRKRVYVTEQLVYRLQSVLFNS